MLCFLEKFYSLSDNHFVMEKGGEIADLLSFSPAEFDLLAGETATILHIRIEAKCEEWVGENS